MSPLVDAALDIDKKHVAASFSKAARSYNSAAHLQRGVAQDLMASLPENLEPKWVLDIGCGTGFLTAMLRERFPEAQIVALDIAIGMLRYARERVPGEELFYVGADAEALPFADQSFDLIASSFALQWCTDLARLFERIENLLLPGGRFVFSLPGTGTLEELKKSWQLADPSHVHVNEFPSADGLAAMANRTFAETCIRTMKHLEYHKTLMDLMKSIKAIGAHNVLAGRSRKLTGKQTFLRLENAYERFRHDEAGLPASWQVIMGECVR